MGMKRALYTNKNIENVHWNDVKHGDKQQNSTISSDFLLPRSVIADYFSDTIRRVYKHQLQVFLKSRFFPVNV